MILFLAGVHGGFLGHDKQIVRPSNILQVPSAAFGLAVCVGANHHLGYVNFATGR